MQLDPFTILVACAAVLILQGATFVFFWLRDRSSAWFLWWGPPLILGGAAIIFYTRPGWETEFAPIAVGNALRMVAIGCLWQGIRLFYGRRLLLWPLAAIALGWLGLCLIPEIRAEIAPRVIIVSLVNAMLCAAAAWELHLAHEEALPSRRPLLVTFASFAVLMTVRVATASVAPFPLGGQPVDSAWLGAFVLLVSIHVAFAAILFFSLTRERREAEQRSFAMSDPLTGLLNRRAFGDFAERIDRRRTSGQRSALALLVLDLDHFKSINDRFGHEIGDRMLKAFADTAEQAVRPSDHLFRMGGEEFCFDLPETEADEAIAVAERVRGALEAMEVPGRGGVASTTVSIGVAATRQPVALEILLAAADAAVYEAKARGRNRVVVAEPASILRVARPEPAAALRRRA
ncbi:MAG: GGDEF domain-containing protein [Devosia sp.]